AALLAWPRASRALEGVVRVRIVAAVVAVEGKQRDVHVRARRVRERVDQLRRVVAGVGPGYVALVAPCPAAFGLDRRAAAARDGVNPVVTGIDSVGARVRRARVGGAGVGGVVVGRRKRRAWAWRGGPDALREEWRAAVVDLHVDVVSVHRP